MQAILRNNYMILQCCNIYLNECRIYSVQYFVCILNKQQYILFVVNVLLHSFFILVLDIMTSNLHRIAFSLPR